MQLHVSASAYVQQTFKTVLLGYGEKNTEQKELHQLPFSNILFNISINIETICPAIAVREVDSQMLQNEWKLEFLRSVEWRAASEGKPGNVTASSLDNQLVAADCLKTERASPLELI